jgi:hypothetical protein
MSQEASPVAVLKRSLRYFAGSILHPHDTFVALGGEPTFAVGFVLTALKWGLCEFYVLYLYLTDQVMFAEPWLNIPVEQYRFYQLFFYVPYGFVLWILLSGVVQVLSQSWGGKGSFESSLNILGIVVFTPLVFIDSLDTLIIILNGGNWSPVLNPLTRVMYVIWSIVLLTIGTHAIHRLGWAKSAVIGVACSVFSVFVNVIFIR